MNLQTFINQRLLQDDVRRIDSEISPRLEIARCCRQEFTTGNGKILLFSNVQGSPYPVVANLFGSQERMLQILRTSTFEDFSQRIANLLRSETGGSAAERLIRLSHRSTLTSSDKQLPVVVSDLQQLPAIQSWPLEVRPYLTLPLVITQNPENGQVNMGLYRAQVIDQNKLALNFAPTSGAGKHLAIARQLGVPLHAAIVLGADPALYWLASAPLPEGCSELKMFQQFFDGELEMMQSVVTGLSIPSEIECLIEGTITSDTCREGPFGNHTGSYVTRPDCPVVQVERISRTQDPVMPITVVGPPPSENIFLAQANRCLIKEMLMLDHPAVADLQVPQITAFHGGSIVSLRDAGKGAVRALIATLRSETSPLNRAKFILLVDEDIDINQPQLCFWRAINQLKTDRIHLHGDCLTVDATGVDPRWLVKDNL